MKWPEEEWTDWLTETSFSESSSLSMGLESMAIISRPSQSLPSPPTFYNPVLTESCRKRLWYRSKPSPLTGTNPQLWSAWCPLWEGQQMWAQSPWWPVLPGGCQLLQHWQLWLWCCKWEELGIQEERKNRRLEDQAGKGILSEMPKPTQKAKWYISSLWKWS